MQLRRLLNRGLLKDLSHLGILDKAQDPMGNHSGNRADLIQKVGLELLQLSIHF
jgi:hypothetical protein